MTVVDVVKRMFKICAVKPLIYAILLLVLLACSGTKKIIEKNTEPENQWKTNFIKGRDFDEVSKENNTVETIEETQIENDTVLSKMDKKILERPIKTHQLWNRLLEKHVSDNGHVNYLGIKKDNAILKSYIIFLSKHMPNSNWTKEEHLSYWINAYNAMTVDLILRHYPIKSIKDIKDPWYQRLWKLGDKWYNLDDIEHQILRKMEEPRIHFAIVCASVSCPKLLNEAYTASNLESQLTNATKDFINDSERNAVSENDLEISKIFQWFTKDFKQDGSLINFLNKYVDITISGKAKITFKDYNWDLNE